MGSHKSKIKHSQVLVYSYLIFTKAGKIKASDLSPDRGLVRH